MNKTIPVTLFWFRRDLRINDNHALFEALKSSQQVLPIFIFDKNILNTLTEKKDKRVSFIYNSVCNLKNELEKSGSSLLILHDEPLNVFKTLADSWNILKVFANHDYEPYAIKRDSAISQWLKYRNIPFITLKDQVIFEKAEVMKYDGTPYTVFTPYSKMWKQKLLNMGIPTYPSEKYYAHFCKTRSFHLPSLNEIGFEKSVYEIPSPEPDKEIIQNYHVTRNIPSVNGTSRLSVHLRFGTVSVRKIATIAKKLNQHWLNELIWREFFMMILYHFPYVVNGCFKKKYDHISWRNNESEFNKWRAGETGYPIVDAGMRELNETGFMHNRVRMIVASFLTKHLLIDWRWGEAYFAEKLLDYELSSNNGNWQWAAGCGCDAAPYFRIFNPSEQARKFDPGINYIKKWIPDFKPGYLPPVVEHEFARKRALEVYKKSLADIA